VEHRSSLRSTPVADWQAELDAFRLTHRFQQRSLAGHSWEYICCGAGEETVIVLPGGLAVAETGFRYINRFEKRYRVLAPTYPDTVSSMAELVDGLLLLMDAEGIAHANLIGGSYSGMVGQCLLRRAPERFRKVVFSDTGVPNPRRARLYAATYWPLVRYLPVPVVRLLFLLGLAPTLLTLPAHRRFWWRHFYERIISMGRAAYVSHLLVWLDFDRHYHFDARDLADWPGVCLLLDAEHDSLFSADERRALRSIYANAQRHTFRDGSHGTSLSGMDDYIDAIERFFAAQTPPL
jgi:aminoacrylate hydrolase